MAAAGLQCGHRLRHRATAQGWTPAITKTHPRRFTPAVAAAGRMAIFRFDATIRDDAQWNCASLLSNRREEHEHENQTHEDRQNPDREYQTRPDRGRDVPRQT